MSDDFLNAHIRIISLLFFYIFHQKCRQVLCMYIREMIIYSSPKFDIYHFHQVVGHPQ